MYRRRPDLGPVPVPQFRSFEPEQETRAYRATTPAHPVEFSHAERAAVMPATRGPLPQVRFFAPNVIGGPIIDAPSTDEGRRSSSRQHRRRRRQRR
jgi:hypothetical protein